MNESIAADQVSDQEPLSDLGVPEIRPVDRSQPVPASDAQLGIWIFESERGDAPPAYNIPTVVRLRGSLDVHNLEQAINRIISRHDILSCTFRERDGDVVQVPGVAREIRLPVEAVTESEVAARVAAHAAIPFSVTQGPLVRWVLFEIAQDDHQLLMLQHHIISDGQSVGLLVQELIETYGRLGRGDYAERPAPALQYADFAAFQRAPMQAERKAEAVDYWVKMLKDVPLLELPTDHTRPLTPGHRGRRHHFRLPAEVVSEVRRFARTHRVTPYAILFTAHALLIARYSGQNDFVVTMPVDGRTSADLSETLGCFVSLLPVRCRIDKTAGFSANLDTMFDALLEGATFQEAPFHRIVAALAAEEANREAALAKVFKSLFVLDSFNRDLKAEVDGLSASVTVEADHNMAKSDICFAMQEVGDEIAAYIEYDIDLFDDDTITRMADHFTRLLVAAMAAPDQPTGTLPILSAAEFSNLIITANETATPFPRDRSLAALFENAVRRFPGQPAYAEGELSVDYATLDRRATAFAHALLGAGLAAGGRVAILLDRGLDALIAIVATVKAGGVYVPADPTYPDERIALMLDDADVRIVVVDDPVARGAIATTGRVLLTVGAAPETTVPVRPSRPRRATDTAYIYYTSGTTGHPRGVIVRDVSVNRLVFETNYLAYRPDLRIGFASNIVFDAATLEIWGTLLHGGCLVQVPRATLLEVEQLAELLRKQRINVIILTAPLFHRFAEELPTAFAGMEAIITGGAVVAPAAVSKVLHCALPPASVFNCYGPTETTTIAAAQKFTPVDVIDQSRSLPIGKAISNTSLYVVDSLSQPVPVGVPGELLIGGPGVAEGYLNHPQRTREKFVTLALTHPDLPDAPITDRVYRTGDVVKWRGDGTLEFLGRVDRQIKLRGYRVELDEIEAAILSHPAVAQTVVVSRGAGAELRLDAYYSGASAPSIEALKAYLGKRLPAYMVPQRFARAEQLPVDVAGKINVGSLPPISEPVSAPVVDTARPQSPIERALSQIIGDVLGCMVTGANDDFFALGGDSIQSIRVAGRARDRGFMLTVRDIFEHRTIARMAGVLEQRAPSLSAASAGEERAEIDLLPVQRWFFDRDFAAVSHFNLALLLKYSGKLDRARLQRAVNQLIVEQEALRSRWPAPPASGVVRKQVILPPGAAGEIEVQVHHLTSATEGIGDEIAQFCTAWQSGFDIADGPILAARIIEGHPDGCDRLFLSVHHLAIDVVSCWIVVEQLRRLYDADRQSAPSTGESGALGHWARLLTAHANTAATARELPYWVDAISGPRHFAVDVDPDAEPRLQRERRLRAAVFSDAARAGESLLGLRPNEVIIAAALLALAGETGECDVTTTIEGHGREEQALFGADLSRTVGWFTSLHPCRVRLPKTADGRGGMIEALAEIKDALRSAPNNGIGFGALKYLSSDPAVTAALSGWPGADLSVNYLGGLDIAAGDWRLEDDAPGDTVSARNRPSHALDVTAFKAEDDVVIALTADGRRVAPALADEFCDRLIGVLTDIATLASEHGARLTTASDHPLSGLDRGTLTRLLGAAGSAGRKVLRLTPVEEGMLFEALRHPESDAYTIQMHWRHAGALDPLRLKRAFEALVQRHDALRGRYVIADLPHPVRIVEPRATIEWRVLDWRHADEREQVEARAKLLAEDRRRGFDLTAPAGARVMVLHHADASWEIIWTYHHIFFDGWSVFILLADLSEIYESVRSDGSLDLPRPPAFDAFLAGQARTPDAECVDFWSGELADFSEPTDLPFRLPGTRLATGGADGACVRRHAAIPEQLMADLKTLSVDHAVTPSSAFQCAWALALARCARTDDVIYGTTASGRTLPIPNVDQMVGLAISTVPVRVRFDAQASAIDTIRALHAKTVTIQEHAHISLAELHQLSALPAGERLFHSLFVYENYPVEGLSSRQGLQYGELDILDKTDTPLTVLVVPGADPHFVVSYDPTLFSADAIDRLCGHVVMLLQGIVRDPAERIGNLDMLTPQERHDLLVTFNATDNPVDLTRTVLDLIGDRVAVHPDRIAVTAANDSLTYSQLDAVTTALAHRIRRRYANLKHAEMPAETVIALTVERGLGMIVSILAVMKAGGAWLPIDTDDPVERVAFILEDANAALILADRNTGGRYGTQFGDRLMVVGEAEDDVADGPLPRIERDHLAYLMYTSGSTGRPKGTLVEHRGIVNRLAWMQHDYHALTPDDRVLQKTPYTFDVSVWELLWPLVQGARLVFSEPGGHRDPAYLYRVIADQAITVVHFVPSMLQVFLEHPGLEKLTTIRMLATSGERLPTKLSACVLSALPDVKMINFYGPTEATIDVSGYVCTRDDERDGPITPIGLPAWNTSLYILGPEQRLMPVGVPGELYIGGTQVARGYLNRAELTAERFIDNPYGPGRLYRTGDLVWRRADGVIDYLGRIDFQLKVRGMRVEPGEIEAALEGYPGVSKACVVASAQGGGLLVAYVTGDETIAEEDVKGRLATTLPDHMVPASIIRLQAFPLTSSGKVDRKRLPEAVQEREAEAAAVPPVLTLSPTEEIVAAAFGDVLKANGRVDVGRSFFALGGHSLTAMRLAMRLSKQFGLDVPVRLVFDHSRVRDLAAALDRMTLDKPVSSLTRIDRAGELRPSFAQTRILFLERFATAPGLYNVPVAMRITGGFVEAAFERAAAALLDAHEILRTRYLLVDGEPRLEIDPLPQLDLEVADIAPEMLEEVLRAEANTGFALDKAPPIRFRIWRLGPDEWALVVMLHHIVTDGWSLDLLLAELAQRYEAELPGGVFFSPPKALTYVDFAAWQRETLDDLRTERYARYWRERLHNAPVLDFPLDRPRPPVASYRGGVANFALDKSETDAIERFCADNCLTLFPVLLAVWATVLSRYCPQNDFVIGTPAANRPLAETEDMLGLFQNTIPLRVTLQDHESLAALAKRLAAQATEDFAHQDLPFELIIEALGIARDPSRTALAQTVLIYDDRDPNRAVFAPRGLTATPMTVDNDTAKADLTAAFLRSENGLIGAIEYATDLFVPETMERLCGHVLRVLRAFADDPTQDADTVDMLTPSERRELLETFNGTDHPVDLSRTVLGLIADTIAARPDTVAVAHGEERLTYAEIDRASTRLAWTIRDRYKALEGAEMPPETVVALVLERGISMIVSILAVMKAGGAYLPIDPDDPADRVAFMLEDAAAAAIVVDARTVESGAAAACPVQRVVRADQDLTANEARPLPDVAPAQLAYVMYTSGSTGRPKGTLIEHRNLVNRMAWVQGEFPLSPDDRVLQKTPYTFDVSVSELLWPLTAGACLVFADPGRHGDPAYLHRLIKDEGVTIMHFVPSMLQAFVAYPGLETLTTLRYFLLIGEPLPSRLSTHVLETLPSARMINLYGPTEASIDVSAHPCSPDDQSDGSVVAIGRPGWNTTLHVLDAHRRLVPIGVPGELAIGGAQLARGYLNRPELTADGFIDDPFGDGRLYRTGDLVRRRTDGEIEHLGRMDFQVKVRGMRVELGEVEAQLEARPGIDKACVIAAEVGGERSLIAYVTGSATVDERDVVTRLAAELPDHMIPARVVKLDAFPLTTSGKIDRKKLPSPAASPRPRSVGVEARTATEQALSAVWRDVLGHGDFSCQDGFFDVGGTSLGAMRMVSAIAQRFGKALPIVSVFRYPTVRDLAAHLDQPDQQDPGATSNVLDAARRRAEARRARRIARQS